MGCICPEKGHLFLILIKAPSACQAVHLQGCLYLVGKSFAHLYKGYGAIWASRGPANEKTPYPLPQWLFHERTHDQSWSIRILPWTFIWQLQVSHLMAGDAKLKGWSQPYSSIHGESICSIKQTQRGQDGWEMEKDRTSSGLNPWFQPSLKSLPAFPGYTSQWILPSLTWCKTSFCEV